MGQRPGNVRNHMNSNRLGRTEFRVSAVSLGTWAFGGPHVVDGRAVGWFGSNDRLAHMSLIKAHAAGINHWDTADVYGDGHAERLISHIWRQVPRDQVVLASKVGWDSGPYGHYYHPEQIRRQLERSLRNLGTDCLDIYYLHHCDFGPDDAYLDAAVELLQRFRDEGKLRHIGLSDWSCEKLHRYVDRVSPDVVQCYRNAIDDTYASSGLQAWVEANDVGAVFFSPLKHGLLLGQFEGPVTFGIGDHRNNIEAFRDFALLTRLRSCRRKMTQRFGDYPEPVLAGLVGSLLGGCKAASVLVGLHRPSQVIAAGTTGEPLGPEDVAWVQRLYQENGRPTRASWKMQADSL